MKALEHDKDTAQWLMQQVNTGYEIFDTLDDLPKYDIRTTIAIDPIRSVQGLIMTLVYLANALYRIEKLLLRGEVNMISKYYKYMDELVSIRRSTASILIRNESGDQISMRSMMPKHVVKKAELTYSDKEAVEAQFLHGYHAR